MFVRGFTLLELLITVCVLALILAVGLPNLSQQIERNRTRAAAASLMDAVQLTRATAVTHNNRTTLRALGTWHDGWELFMDTNHNGSREPGERLLLLHDEPLKGVRISGNYHLRDYVSFLGTGQSRKATGFSGGGLQIDRFTVCPAGQGKGYQLVLSRGGRMRMINVSSDVCDAL